jgi:hypothetical protein
LQNNCCNWNAKDVGQSHLYAEQVELSARPPSASNPNRQQTFMDGRPVEQAD